MPRSVSTDIALLVFLVMIVAAIIFPILGNMPPSEEETAMIARMGAAGGAGSIARIFDSGSNIFIGAYVHIALLIQGLLPMISDVVALRLPGALAVMALTLCLFRFGGSIDRYSSSFLASLLFLSSALVMRLTFRASEVVLPAALFIFALMSIYHWLRLGGRRTFWLVVFSAAIATVLIGATAPIALALMAYVFLLASRPCAVRRFASVTAALLLACFSAFLIIYVLVGDTATAMSIFDIRQQLAEVPGDISMVHVFVNYIVFAIFPWSIPIIISLPWIMRRPGNVYRRFLGLPLLQRYSIIIFLFSLPFMLFVTDLTVVLLLASVYFNMPLIGRYLLMQSGRHDMLWRVAGFAFAAVVAVLLAAYVLLARVPAFGAAVGVSLTSGAGAWSMVLVAAAFFGIYTLWRNARTIGQNNRFLYNVIFLYITTAVIFAGYVAGRLSW